MFIKNSRENSFTLFYWETFANLKADQGILFSKICLKVRFELLKRWTKK